MIKLNYISVKTAEAIKAALEGKVLPSENRVLVFSPGDDEATMGSIIIPGNVKDGKPRKGVVIIQGKLDENHTNFDELTRTGLIITYGLYAGKEVDLWHDMPSDISLKEDNWEFTVLALNEIIFIHENKNI